MSERISLAVAVPVSEAPKKRRRKRTPRKPTPMSRGRQELHRIVRETMEKGYGTHYGAYVATLPRPASPPKEDVGEEISAEKGDSKEDIEDFWDEREAS